MRHHLVYDGMTKSYKKAAGESTIMPAENNTRYSEANFMNGSPFGAFNPDAPLWPPDEKSKEPKTTRRRRVLKGEGKYLSQRGWKDTTSRYATTEQSKGGRH